MAKRESWRKLWRSRKAMLDDFALFDREEAEMLRQQNDETRPITDDDVATIIRLAREHDALLDAMRTALEAGDDDEALRIARRVAGLPEVKRDE